MNIVLRGIQTGFEYQGKITQLGMQYIVGNVKLNMQPSIGMEFMKYLPA